MSRDDKVCKWSIKDAVMKNCAKTTMVMEGKNKSIVRDVRV